MSLIVALAPKASWDFDQYLIWGARRISAAMFPMFANAPNPIVPLMFSGSTYPTSTPALLRPRSVLAHAFCDTAVQNNRTAHTAIRCCISHSMLAMRNGPRQLRLLNPEMVPAEDHDERKMRTRTGRHS